MLTVQVLTKDNVETVGECLASLEGVECRVLIGDMGSSDKTKEVCESFGADVIDVGFNDDMSALRNSMCGEGPNMYIEPWEKLARGHQTIGGLKGGHHFYVIQEGMISKQVRYWEAGRFENPVFESVAGAEAVVTPQVVIVGGKQPDFRARNTRVCQEWAERRPTSPDPHYYLACSLLSQGRREEFVVSAKKFLTISSPGESAMMMNYYLSRVELSLGDSNSSFKRVVGCIAAKPSMAEFWCLLGDVLFHKGEYGRAMEMYTNAISIGKRRRSDDSLPMDIAKYESYPLSMEKKCLSFMSKGRIVGIKTH